MKVQEWVDGVSYEDNCKDKIEADIKAWNILDTGYFHKDVKSELYYPAHSIDCVKVIP